MDKKITILGAGGRMGKWFTNYFSAMDFEVTGFDSENEVKGKSVIKADFAEAGDEDVFRKLKADLKNHNITDEENRKKMDELNEKAKSEFK